MKFLLSLILFLLNSFNVFALDVESFTMENGLAIHVIPMHKVPIVTSVVIYSVGANEDPIGKSGLAHYLEHLMFRGTKNYKEIPKFLDEQHAIYNASTHQYYTMYHERVHKEKLEKILKLEADRMKNLVIDDESEAGERKIVLEERKTGENSLYNRLLEELYSAFYRNNRSWNVIGWEHEINSFNKQDAMAMYTKYYTPNNAAILLVGDITIKEALPMIKGHFGTIKSSSNIRRNIIYEPPHNALSKVSISSTDVKRSDFISLYKAPSFSYNKEEVYALFLAKYLLGHGRSSYLYKKMVMEDNVAVDVSVDFPLINIGDSAFSIEATVQKGANIETLEESLTRALNAWMKDGFSQESLDSAKRRIITEFTYIFEDHGRIVNFFSNAIALGINVNSLKNIGGKFNTVKIESVNNALSKLLKSENPVKGYLVPKG